MKLKIKRFIQIIFLFIFINIAFVSGDECDWGVFGNAYTPLWNEQFVGCAGNIVNPTNVSILFGKTTGALTQPIVSNFVTNSINTYLLINNGNYLQIYDKNLALVQEVNTGVALGTPAVLDFFGTGSNKSIANIYRINNSLSALKVISYDDITGLFNETFQQNITGATTIAGVRYFGDKNIYFANATAVFVINYTTTTIINHELGNIYPVNPPAYYVGFAGDSIPSFMVWHDNGFRVFRNDGSNIFNRSFGFPASQIFGVRMIKTDASNIWKIAYLFGDGRGSSPSLSLIVAKQDGSTFCSASVLGSGQSNAWFDGDVAISEDYNGDGYPDIYVYAHVYNPASSDVRRFMVLEGDTCNTLFTASYSSENLGNNPSLLTIADMNFDLKNDFIVQYYDRLEIINPYTSTTLLNLTGGIPYGYCIPSDLDFDGKLDVICSETSNTKVFFTNYTNALPVIVSVTYDTGTTIAVNTTLNMYVTATDTESDVVYCSVDCLGNGSFTADTGTTLSCFYNSLGIFQNTIRCRDVYHPTTYATHTQTIVITATGVSCDNDGICEGGETTSNCPSDCGSGFGNTTQSSTGGIPIPVEIVSVTNTNQGLLPEVYFGILGFLSNTLQPFIILIFVIFIVLIIFVIARIIKKMADKVGR